MMVLRLNVVWKVLFICSLLARSTWARVLTSAPRPDPSQPTAARPAWTSRPRPRLSTGRTLPVLTSQAATSTRFFSTAARPSSPATTTTTTKTTIKLTPGPPTWRSIPARTTPQPARSRPVLASTQWVEITCSELYSDTAGSDAIGTDDRYAQSFVPDIADVANVSQTRVLNPISLRNPVNGTLVIQFGIEDEPDVRAVEAVTNLKRRFLPEHRRTRRAVHGGVEILRSSLYYNQTVTPHVIYNWTEDGPCPTDRCRPAGSLCRRRPGGQFYCACSSDDVQCSPVTNTTCLSEPECIVPAVIVAVALFTVIVVTVALLLARLYPAGPHICRQTSSNDSVLELNNVDTQSVANSSSLGDRPQLPAPRKPPVKKLNKWTRLRFKRTRKQLDPVATDETGYPRAAASTIELDAESAASSDSSGLPTDRSTTTNGEPFSY